MIGYVLGMKDSFLRYKGSLSFGPKLPVMADRALYKGIRGHSSLVLLSNCTRMLVRWLSDDIRVKPLTYYHGKKAIGKTEPDMEPVTDEKGFITTDFNHIFGKEFIPGPRTYVNLTSSVRFGVQKVRFRTVLEGKKEVDEEKDVFWENSKRKISTYKRDNDLNTETNEEEQRSTDNSAISPLKSDERASHHTEAHGSGMDNNNISLPLRKTARGAVVRGSEIDNTTFVDGENLDLSGAEFRQKISSRPIFSPPRPHCPNASVCLKFKQGDCPISKVSSNAPGEAVSISQVKEELGATSSVSRKR